MKATMIKKKALTILVCLLLSSAFAQTCTFFADVDGDAYGDPMNSVVLDCNSILVGYVENDLDCDDSNPNINPDAAEVCNGVDDNCNGGEIDEFVSIPYYQDSDGDGYGDPNFMILDCNLPSGFVENMDDCDDALITYIDADGDGFGSDIMDPCGAPNNLDCNDNTAAIQDSTTYYADIDEDGYGDPNNTLISCNLPAGYITDGTDCNDLDLDIYPGAPDILGNGIDENCDGQDGVGIDESEINPILFFPNPSHEIIQITHLDKYENWAIYNSLGQCILRGQNNTSSFLLEVNSWSKGCYFIRTSMRSAIFVID